METFIIGAGLNLLALVTLGLLVQFNPSFGLAIRELYILFSMLFIVPSLFVISAIFSRHRKKVLQDDAKHIPYPIELISLAIGVFSGALIGFYILFALPLYIMIYSLIAVKSSETIGSFFMGDKFNLKSILLITLLLILTLLAIRLFILDPII